jgi:hypothetical protein
MNRMTIVLIVLAALLGLFFGNALGGIVWGLAFAVGTAILAWIVGTRTRDTEITVEEPGIAHFLFKDPAPACCGCLPASSWVGSG